MEVRIGLGIKGLIDASVLREDFVQGGLRIDQELTFVILTRERQQEVTITRQIAILAGVIAIKRAFEALTFGQD